MSSRIRFIKDRTVYDENKKPLVSYRVGDELECSADIAYRWLRRNVAVDMSEEPLPARDPADELLRPPADELENNAQTVETSPFRRRTKPGIR